jgi:CheY-like chemotaxis protein
MSIKVLVADDSITIQKVIGIIFGGDEYSLTIVDNGKAAVDKAREVNPDVMLIDALMPGMTGYEAAEIIRATPSLATKPILLLTGSFEPFDEEKAKKCGADDFIAKPFESQQIISKVKELLELGSSRAQAAPQAAAPVFAAPAAAVEAAPVFDIPPVPPVAVAPPASAQEAPADIWGAFTPDVEEAPVAPSAPLAPTEVPAAQPAPAEATQEVDVFAIVSEEDNGQLVQEPLQPQPDAPQHTGSQWIPVEENTFEFEEQAAPTVELAPPFGASAPVQETSFGDISFEDNSAVTETPTFATPPETFFAPVVETPVDVFSAPISEFEAPLSPAEPFAPLADPAPSFTAATEPEPPVIPAATLGTIAPVALSEDQLKEALAGVSRDIIERIVWEVVPDLAESMIREAIRRIKEGV